MHSSFLMLPSETVHYRRNIQFSVFARSLRYVRKPFLVRCICAKVSFQKIFLPQRLFIRLGKTVRTPSALMQANISKTLPDFRDVLRVWSVSLCVKMTYALNIATNIKEPCPDCCRAPNFYTSRLQRWQYPVYSVIVIFRLLWKNLVYFDRKKLPAFQFIRAEGLIPRRLPRNEGY